jgi:Ran GTPase-activating protein (RanGAP) involved in mRNA processing and transport
MEMLLEFMRNKEQIRTLNLRKNKIGNEGAKLLAHFITHEDSTLLEVDLNRNRIEEDGAQELVDAIHKTIRIEKFHIGYGNLISSYLVNAFD